MSGRQRKKRKGTAEVWRKEGVRKWKKDGEGCTGGGVRERRMEPREDGERRENWKDQRRECCG